MGNQGSLPVFFSVLLGLTCMACECAPATGRYEANDSARDAAGEMIHDSEVDAGSTATSRVPEGCTEITVGTLRNGQQFMPPRYEERPTLSGYLAVDYDQLSIADLVQLKLSHSTHSGDYSFARANAQWSTCEQCLRVRSDYVEGNDTQLRQFLAVEGSLRVERGNSAEQVSGTLRDVRLVEIELRIADGTESSSIVDNGRCLFLREATFNTNVENGCSPLEANLCAAGRTCAPVNASGSDGTCVASQGARKISQTCALNDVGDSDCSPGLVCWNHQNGEPNGTCVKPCDPLRAEPQTCPENFACGAFALCWPINEHIAIDE